MTIQLTKGMLTALARVDTAGLSYLQRLDAFAKALGYKNQAAIMAVFKHAPDATTLVSSPSGRGTFDPYAGVPIEEHAHDSVVAFLQGNYEPSTSVAGILSDIYSWHLFIKRQHPSMPCTYARHVHERAQNPAPTSEETYDQKWILDTRPLCHRDTSAISKMIHAIEKIARTMDEVQGAPLFPWILTVPRREHLAMNLNTLVSQRFGGLVETLDTSIENALAYVRAGNQHPYDSGIHQLLATTRQVLSEEYIEAQRAKHTFLQTHPLPQPH